jgi:ATP-dependent Zn protease
MTNINEARDRITIGKTNIGLIRSKEEVTQAAYHESAHALTSILQSHYPMQFDKVTILSRGGTLGVSHSVPFDDLTGYSKEQMEAIIVVCLAGRAAEKLIFGLHHTGIYSDFERATQLAYDMVTKYGMGEKTGIVSYEAYKKISPETAREIDLTVKNILEDCYNRSYILLEKNKIVLESLVENLLEKETLEAEEVYKIANLSMPSHYNKDFCKDSEESIIKNDLDNENISQENDKKEVQPS